MSVLIKREKMPKSCGNCFYDTRCDKWRLRNFGAPPPYDCPLVPVPAHGRLIEEVDAVETAWMILRGLGYLKEENPQLEQTVREVFATAPAIEVEEHG